MIASRGPADTASAIARWTALVAGAPPRFVLPRRKSAHARATPLASRSAEIAFGSTALSSDVAGLASSEGASEATVWLAAFAALLARYSGETELLLAVSGAPGDEGDGASCLVLVRLEVSLDMTFSDALASTAENLRAASRECAVPFAALPELAAAFAADPAALAHAAFGWAADDAPEDVACVELGELNLTLLQGARGAPSDAVLRYRPDVFEAETVRRLAGHLATFIRAVAHEPELALARVPILTQAECEQFADWNATGKPCRTDAGMVELLREQAARTPDAPAVQWNAATLSYSELDERVNRLATYLQALGVAPQVLVGLLVERSLDMYVAVLGIQRAGGAYLPIDPDHPPDRIAFMLNDSGAALVVAHESLRSKLPHTAPQVVSLDAERDAIAASSAAPPQRCPGPDELAYVIYTSGSTGRPKGVQIEHRQLTNLLCGMEAVVGLKGGDTLVAVTPLAFDISVLDIYLPLTSGARVVLASREVAVDPKALATLMECSGVTLMQATPSTWGMLLDAGWRGSAGLTAVCGGEALPAQLAERLLARAHEVWNLYGPTEATVWATALRLRAGETPTIGRPLANVSAYVLDAALEPVPVGVAGELYLAGAGLARGYLNRPELTAERFLPDPFGKAGTRIYRTGDSARFCADGSIAYLGRADFQIKLRGYRIELGEVEAALCAHPEVAAAVVVVREDIPGEPHLAGYAVLRPASQLTPAALRRSLGSTLPAYMIPDAVLLLDALPLNHNGKIDRSRLPAPERGVGRDGGRTPYVAPRSTLEGRLVAIWQDILDIRPVGVTDDFFELGASSIVAARVFDRIERELGATLPLSPLFAAPTIERLAESIGRGDIGRRYTALVPIQPRGAKPPLFCVHGGAGTILHFHSLARALGDAQPFYGLQMQGLYGDAPPHVSVEAMARHYIRELRTVQSHGPYALAGYCFGAHVAFEMARQLERAGEPVALLATINGPSPGYAAAHRRRRGRRWKLRVFGYGLYGRVCAALRRPLHDAWREQTIYTICYAAEKRYEPGVFNGAMLLFKAANLYDERTLGWGEHVAHGVHVVDVPGDQKNGRSTLQEPHVRYVAARLAAALSLAFEPAAARC